MLFPLVTTLFAVGSLVLWLAPYTDWRAPGTPQHAKPERPLLRAAILVSGYFLGMSALIFWLVGVPAGRAEYVTMIALTFPFNATGAPALAGFGAYGWSSGMNEPMELYRLPLVSTGGVSCKSESGTSGIL